MKVELRFIGNTEDIENLFKKLYSNENPFNFDNIISTPKDLLIEHSIDGYKGVIYIEKTNKLTNDDITKLDDEFIQDFLKLEETEKTKCIELGKQYNSNLEKYGYFNSYDYRYEKWGTPINTFNHEIIDKNTIRFSIETYFPYTIMKMISKEFPNIQIDFDYADIEDGYNSGSGYITNGTCFGGIIEDLTDKSHEIYNYLNKEK